MISGLHTSFHISAQRHISSLDDIFYHGFLGKYLSSKCSVLCLKIGAQELCFVFYNRFYLSNFFEHINYVKQFYCMIKVT